MYYPNTLPDITCRKDWKGWGMFGWRGTHIFPTSPADCIRKYSVRRPARDLMSKAWGSLVEKISLTVNLFSRKPLTHKKLSLSPENLLPCATLFYDAHAFVSLRNLWSEIENNLFDYLTACRRNIFQPASLLYQYCYSFHTDGHNSSWGGLWLRDRSNTVLKHHQTTLWISMRYGVLNRNMSHVLVHQCWQHIAN